jgi:Icc-related predicted phosphoesterase/uncharacterized protein YprB with RNaseH-like and TPR domain
VYSFLKKIEPIDFIIYSGDDLNRFMEYGDNHLTRLSRYSKSGLVLAVIGNDDLYPVAKYILSGEGIHDLYEQSLCTDKYAFIGLEASSGNIGLFNHDEHDYALHLKNQIKKVKDKRIVIVSHAPPKYVLDRGVRFEAFDDDSHYIGSQALRDFIENNVVDLVICGHCHTQGGMYEKKCGSTIVNVASHDSPGSHGNFAVIELAKDGYVSVELSSTKDLIAEDSPMRLRYVGPAYCNRLSKYGLDTIDQIIKLENFTEASSVTGLSVNHLKKIQFKAKSLVNSETFLINDFEMPQKELIFFDIETDLTSPRHVWLIGLLIDDQFIQLFAKNWEEERSILSEFLELLLKYPDRVLVSYSTKNFDYRVVLNALIRQNLDYDFFEQYPHIDLGTRLSRCFIFPNQSFALKELGAFLGYSFKHSELNGLAVGLNYLNYIEKGEELDQRVFEYNEDDVRAIPFLIEKASSLSVSRVFNDNY